MARRQRDPALERQWRERMARWRASGLSVRAFCQQRGLTEPTFHYWKRELRVRDVAAATGGLGRGKSLRNGEPNRRRPSPPKRLPTFVPLTVLPSATLAVEVRCPSGHVVCLPSCEVSALASLFAALNRPASEAPSC